MKSGSISISQFIAILMLSTGLMNHVIIIPTLLDAAKRDAWLSVIVTGAIMLVWAALLYVIIRRINKQHLIHYLMERIPPIMVYALVGLICIYLFLIFSITVNDTINWIKLSFSPRIPIFVLSLLLTTICCINALLGIQSISNIASVLLPFVILLGIFAALSTVPHKDYSLIKPILEYGMQPVWNGVLYAGAGFSELIFLLFIQHKIKSKISYPMIMLFIFILVGLTIGPLMGSIVEFGAEHAAKLRYPAYEEWRLITIGHYIEHLDFLSIYQWFSGAFIRISLSLFLILEILCLKNTKQRFIVIAVILIMDLVLNLMPVSSMLFLLFLKQILPIFFFGVILFTVVLSLMILLPKRERGLADD
ncbi:endospore germination permease [Paenibacillus aquistagni]|uniref:endospore germination permease n=1 Tax=Paenibacillus aquistagni TaxID=1852522 RepID=UPI00145A9E32|nr:endospore germination permease [Paenibacillus aquistagni]NMM52769.1 endospore germination permease [Paenibacillus aquistagni]